LQFIEDRNLNRTSLTYGTAGGQTVVTAVSEPAGRKLTLQYDAGGRISSLTDPAGNRVVYGYDAAAHLTSAQDRGGHTDRYAYDAITHNLTQLTDKEGNRYQYSYTYNDRVSFQIDPLGSRTTFDYLWSTVHVMTSTATWSTTTTAMAARRISLTTPRAM
jgi:YD repeat-containing protein